MKYVSITALLLAIVILLSACGGNKTEAQTTANDTTAAATEATKLNLTAAAEAVKNGADYSSVSFVGKNDEYSADALYVYFGEDAEIIGALEDFTVSEMIELTVKTMAIFKFSEGTSADVITRAKTMLVDEYIPTAVSSVKLYDPTQEEIANSYVIRDYGDNTFAFVIYGDAAANEEIFKLIESAK